MQHLRGASLPLFFLASLFAITSAAAQTSDPLQIQPVGSAKETASLPGQGQPAAAPIASDAPHMSKQTRLEIIRDFETQIVYARSAFPMGAKGLKLKDGATEPNGQDLQQALALWGPAIKPGDPAQISFVQIRADHIHFDVNGGPIHRKKWYQHIEVSGTGGASVPIGPNQSPQNPHGSYLDVYFDKYVPEMSAQQLRDLLLPVFDFKARSKEEAYLDTVPQNVKQAIQAHHILVGMSTEMVLHAKGKPPSKVRERDGETEYEEWIYGAPPDDVDFVRIVADEVVRVETMKVGGEKIVRTEKEVILHRPDSDTEAKKENQERPPNAPTMRRPGEDAEDAPKPTDVNSPVPAVPPPSLPPPPGNPGPGYVAGR